MPKKPKPAKPAGHVLFVRIDAALLDVLDTEVRRQYEANPGQRVTRSDVARSWLWKTAKG